MEQREFLDFMDTAEKLKCNTRHSWTSSGRHESVAEHSWRLAMMAYLLKDEFPGVDISRVIAMCLWHDMGEAVTGDIPAFLKTKTDESAEEDAVAALLARFSGKQRSELEGLFAEMNALESEEARLYKALDRLEALIQHNEAELSTWLPLEYELQMTYGTPECETFPYLKKLRDMVREDSRKKAGQKAPAEHMR